MNLNDYLQEAKQALAMLLPQRETVYQDLSDDELYASFSRSKWEQLDTKHKVALLQEVENRHARLSGRKPITVSLMSEKESKPGQDGTVMGYFRSLPPALKLNVKYFVKGVNSPNFSPWGALNTVLHEGRHAYQNEVFKDLILRQKMESGMTRQEAFRWLCDKVNYQKTGMLYYMQQIEMDARRYALDQMTKTFNRLAAKGTFDRELILMIRQEKARELEYIRQSMKLVTPEVLKLVEESKREAMLRLGHEFPSDMVFYPSLHIIMEFKHLGAERLFDLLHSVNEYSVGQITLEMLYKRFDKPVIERSLALMTSGSKLQGERLAKPIKL